MKVCFDIHLNIVGETQHENSTLLKKIATVRWKLGTCASLNSIEIGTTYQYPAVYTERCCLQSGRHTLVCYNTPPARGWNNAYIMIDGHRYCDDFISFKSFQKINVASKNLSTIYVMMTCNIIYRDSFHSRLIVLPYIFVKDELK